MNPTERAKITDLKKCNFKEVDAYFKRKSEERKAMTKEQRNVSWIESDFDMSFWISVHINFKTHE